ncbi:hypothetical protein ARMSODRAFT_1027360 [Armillaria solidipes]|uniref:Zn(2)-C6 fungal-type domain-containing protein n=1 Tax=Armillaria solidipes TaxID=1076256 RepID=A0A2H3APC3_9AGAR|nr:hypothetical protein ARMSODRAFT_1027360 [Armillaria solidipes]
MPTLKKNPKTTYGRIFGAACISCRRTKTKCDINNPCLNCQRHGLADKCRRVTPKTKTRARNSHKEDAVSGPKIKSPGRCVASEVLQQLPFVASSSSVIAISPIDTSELAKELPNYRESCRLCQAYSDLAPWLFGAASAQQVMTEVLPGWYDQGLPKLEGRVDELSLLFAVLSLGVLSDPAGQKACVTSQSTAYRRLSEAALNAHSGTKSVMYTQACALLALCEAITTGENTGRLQKLRSAALEISINITHDAHCSAEMARTKTLLEDVIVTDALQACVLSISAFDLRPSWQLAQSLAMSYPPLVPVECNASQQNEGNFDFHLWKATFTFDHLLPIIQNNEERWPKYKAVLKLSRRLQKQRLPECSQGDCPKGGQLPKNLAFWLPRNYIQLAAVYLHMHFFEHVLLESPARPTQSEYSLSYISAYCNAWDLISSAKILFDQFPAPLACVWDYWLHVFSATVVVYLVAKKVSDSIIHQEAMTRLKSAERLFESAAMYGGRAAFLHPEVRAIVACLEVDSGGTTSMDEDQEDQHSLMEENEDLWTEDNDGSLNGSCMGDEDEGEWLLSAENDCDEGQHVLMDPRGAEDETDGYAIDSKHSYPRPMKDRIEEGGVFIGKIAGGESPKCFPVIQKTEGYHFAADGLWARSDRFFDPVLSQSYANADTDTFKAIASPMQGYSLFPSEGGVSFDFSGVEGASLIDALDAPLNTPFDSNISNAQGCPQPHLQQPAICSHVIETSLGHDQVSTDVVGIEMDPPDGYAMDPALEMWFEGMSSIF